MNSATVLIPQETISNTNFPACGYKALVTQASQLVQKIIKKMQARMLALHKAQIHTSFFGGFFVSCFSK
jgi:hypothetical protein